MSESNLIPLASTTLADHNTSEVVFTGIPNSASSPNYERLKVVFSLRGGWGGTTGNWLRMRYGTGSGNASSSSYYSNVYFFGSGNNTPSIYNYYAQTDWTLGFITGYSSYSGWLHGSVDILDWYAASNSVYSGATTKLLGADAMTYGAGDATGITDSTVYKSGHRNALGNTWSSLHFTLDGSWGTTWKFSADSTFDLYGVESA